MQALPSRSQLWPSMERSGTGGGSPLVLTTLYSLLATARLQTYAWDRHLDNLMPWSAGNPDPATRPSLISNAMWNYQKESTQSKLQNHSQARTLPPLKSPVCPTHLSDLAHQSNGLTKTPSFALCELNSLPPAPSNTPPPIAPKSTSPIWTAPLMLVLLALQSSSTGTAGMPITPPATQHWRNSRLCRIPVVKSWKSCGRMTMAIIQRLWDTAWGLISHRNVESCCSGFGLPTPMGKVTSYPLPAYRPSSPLPAHVLTVI